MNEHANFRGIGINPAQKVDDGSYIGGGACTPELSNEVTDGGSVAPRNGLKSPSNIDVTAGAAQQTEASPVVHDGAIFTPRGDGRVSREGAPSITGDMNGVTVMKDLGLTPIQGEKFAHQARVSSPQMDDILGLGWPVLDHGFVRVVDYMGNEGAIVQAARVSYGIGTQSVSEDRGLLRYLMRHRHSSPFEMCEIKFHIKLPIFIARQWIRHRMASVNEYSARYSILANEFYLPAPEHIATQSKSNKQGRGEMVTPEVAQDVIDLLRADAERNFKNYEDMINPDGDKQLARELARINLTLNTYTEWYWKIDLHNLLHFLRLRVDGHAQFEIRAYAEVILKILMAWVPSVHEAWEDYAFHAHTFSRQEMGVVRLITDIAVKAGLTRPEVLNMAQEHGLSGREARIFADAVFSDQKMVTA